MDVIIRLTHPQITTVRRRVPELHSAQMQLHRTRANRTQSDIELPAIAWRQIVDHLKPRAYGPMGGKRSDLPDSLYLAIQKIQDAVNELESHPAIQGVGALGISGDVIPVWGCESPFSPYPDRSRLFVILVPRHHDNRGVRFTTWYVGTPSTVGVTHQEAFHLLFSVGVEV